MAFAGYSVRTSWDDELLIAVVLHRTDVVHVGDSGEGWADPDHDEQPEHNSLHRDKP